ncbi:MAG: HNH endonuclease family protein [Cetobacterium sp.]|uniref:HNH endonuclease family protein n=1 Tax=Cetobacterium sp. TaxID=2071632 RepID=UPI003EE4D60D
MKVERKSIKIKDLFTGFDDSGEEGVTGYSGLLNIRPPYQREFIYKPEQQLAVINSILAGMPLSCMYWAVNENGTYELLDGQQRTMSICSFLSGAFSKEHHFFCDLSEKEQNQILDYELDVYLCEGEIREKIKWFEVINVAGEELTKQELRNAIFTGPWVLDAKRYFSRTNQAASAISADYVKKSTVRQELLELAISWASGGNIDDYMSKHRHDKDATDLWNHFSEVIHWIRRTFVVPRPKLMQTVDWGSMYSKYKNSTLDPISLEGRIQQLLVDEEVTNHKGVYYYLLTGEEKYLSIRAFQPSVKTRVYAKQGGICVRCSSHFPEKEMEADHITPWSEGGTSVESNCQMLCKKCNRSKGAK